MSLSANQHQRATQRRGGGGLIVGAASSSAADKAQDTPVRRGGQRPGATALYSAPGPFSFVSVESKAADPWLRKVRPGLSLFLHTSCRGALHRRRGGQFLLPLTRLVATSHFRCGLDSGCAKVSFHSAEHVCHDLIQPAECHLLKRPSTCAVAMTNRSERGFGSVPIQSGEFPNSQGARQHECG